MKFTTDKTTLEDAFARCARLASNSLENNAQVKIAGGRMKVTATDMAIVLTSLTDVAQEDPDAEAVFYVEAKRLNGIIAELPAGDIGVAVGDVTLSLDWNGGGAMFPIVADTKFPPGLRTGTDPEKPVHHVTIPREALIRAFGAAMPLLVEEDFRPVTGSVYFDRSADGKVTIVGTDGQALVSYDTDGEERDAEPFGFMLSKSAALVMRDILGKDDANVTIHCDGIVAELATQRYLMATRCPEGRYPSYRGLFAGTAGSYSLKASREILLRAVKRVGTMTGSKDPKDTLIMTLTHGGNTMLLQAQNMLENSSVRDSVPCSWNGPDMKVGFRIKRFLELLGGTDAANVTIGLSDPTKAATFFPDEDLAARGMIMPVPFEDIVEDDSKKKKKKGE